ncbi:MAG: sterol desaturase family protein [Polyangiales bacterium]
MLSALVDAWRDPRALPFLLGSTAVSMGAFLLFAVPLTWIAWREPAWAAPYRLQTRRARAQTLFVPSIARWLVNNALMTAVTALAWPLVALSRFRVGGPLPSAFEVLWQVALFLYLDDFLFYWMHRAMHSGWLFKRVHSVHHRIYTPWAITGHYMHPVEFVLTGSLMILGPMLLGSHLLTIFAWIAVRQWEAAEGHCGYELPWSPSRLIPGSEGAAHHDLHHARVRVNYAGFLPIWDRVFGTYARRGDCA